MTHASRLQSVPSVGRIPLIPPSTGRHGVQKQLGPRAHSKCLYIHTYIGRTSLRSRRQIRKNVVEDCEDILSRTHWPFSQKSVCHTAWMYYASVTQLTTRNSYNSLTRFHGGRSRSIRSAARKTNRSLYSAHCESKGSSASPLAASLPTPRPFRSGQIQHCPADTKDNPGAFSSNAQDMNLGSTSRDDISLKSPQPRVVTKDQVLSVSPDEGVGSLYYASYSTPSADDEFLGLQWGYRPNEYSDISSNSLYSARPRRCSITTNDITDHIQSTPGQRYLPTGLYWEADVPVSRVNRYKANNLVSRGLLFSSFYTILNFIGLKC